MKQNKEQDMVDILESKEFDDAIKELMLLKNLGHSSEEAIQIIKSYQRKGAGDE